MDALLVSRAHELLMLDWAFLRVVGERTYHLFSVLGPAGVGKSRPVAEATRAMAEGRGRRRRPPDQPPTLFEHAVDRGPELGEGLAIWALHAWVWRHNPTRVFADWKLKVTYPWSAHTVMDSSTVAP